MKPLISKAPIASLLNPKRVYVNAAKTDVAATIRRVQREQARLEATARAKVTTLKRKAGT